MRKTFVTAFVALLAILAVVSCDNISSGGSPSGRNDDGMVTVSVNTGGGGSRNLSDALANPNLVIPGATDYLEVIFKSGSSYSRTAAYYTTSGNTGIKVKVPVGTYTASDAIILLGRNSDKTLLATGVLSATSTSSTGPNFSVTTATTSVTFTVESLVTDISAGSAVSGDFKIVETSGTPAFSSTFTGKTSLGVYSGDNWFQVPSATAGIKATLTIDKFNNTGGLIVRGTTGTPVTFSGIAGSPAITAASVSSPAAAGTAIGTNGEIEITFTTPTITTSPGRYMVTFTVPVVGFANGITDQIIWIIRAGTATSDDFIFDTVGGDVKARAIPLLVVNDPVDERDLILGWS